MGGDIRRKEKVESATEFVERMKKVHEEMEAALKKTQEEMKRYADRSRKETEKWEKGDRVLLSTKNLVFKERPARKLIERYIRLLSQTSFSLYLHNQWTNFHKPSCAGKPQIRAICT